MSPVRRVFGIAGFKNAGKTTLVVDLVRELTGRGWRIATVKHAHHDFDIDHPGKDSYRHREAGALEVIVASARRWAHVHELGNAAEPPLPELLARLGPVDLVLVEGWKGGAHPKLEVRRPGYEGPSLAESVPGVVAIVTDDAPAAGAASPAVLSRQDVPAVADFILAHVGLPLRPPG